MDYYLYQLAHLGFIEEKADVMSQGIIESIRLAHESLQLGTAHYIEGELLGANINRSPSAYLCNPQKERDMYRYDVDKTMSLVKLTQQPQHSGEAPVDIGMINWFPVHGTSLNNTNQMVSGDNKGMASYFFEQRMNPPGPSNSPKRFVAAFAQANEASPILSLSHTSLLA